MGPGAVLVRTAAPCGLGGEGLEGSVRLIGRTNERNEALQRQKDGPPLAQRLAVVAHGELLPVHRGTLPTECLQGWRACSLRPAETGAVSQTAQQVEEKKNAGAEKALVKLVTFHSVRVLSELTPGGS